MKEWSLTKINDYKVTDNVASILSETLSKLPIATQHLLQLSSLLGHQFEISDLQYILDYSLININITLKFAEEKNLISPIQTQTNKQSPSTYRFLHDKIQQASFNLIDKLDLTAIHLKIGRKLYAAYKDTQQLQSKTIKIANHMNYGLDLITTEKEKRTVININIAAGNLSKQSNNYKLSNDYYYSALKLLNDSDANYDCWFEIGENYRLMQEYTKAEDIFLKLDKQNDELSKQTKICKALLNIYHLTYQYDKSLAIFTHFLTHFNITFNTKPSTLRIVYKLLKLKIIYPNHIRDLKNISSQEEKKHSSQDQYLLEIFSEFYAAAYYIDSKMFVYTILESTELIVRKKVINNAVIALMTYGLILSSEGHKYKTGLEIATACKDLLIKTKDYAPISKVYFILGGMVQPWVKPLSDSLNLLENGLNSRNLSGDNIYSSYCANYYHHILFYSGAPIEQANEKVIHFLKVNRAEETWLLLGKNCNNFYNALQDLEPFKPDEYFEQINVTKLKTGTSNFLLNNIIYYYLFNNTTKCLESLNQLNALENPFYSLFFLPFSLFFENLMLLQDLKNRSFIKKIKPLSKILKNQKKLNHWSKHCPENYSQLYYLMKAELLNYVNQHKKAKEFYDKSIFVSKQNKATQITAIANECAGNFHLQLNQENLAIPYLKEALIYYEKWGAFAKVKHFEEQYKKYLS